MDVGGECAGEVVVCDVEDLEVGEVEEEMRRECAGEVVVVEVDGAEEEAV